LCQRDETFDLVQVRSEQERDPEPPPEKNGTGSTADPRITRCAPPVPC